MDFFLIVTEKIIHWTQQLLVKWFETLLYPYVRAIVFFSLWLNTLVYLKSYTNYFFRFWILEQKKFGSCSWKGNGCLVPSYDICTYQNQEAWVLWSLCKESITSTCVCVCVCSCFSAHTCTTFSNILSSKCLRFGY